MSNVIALFTLDDVFFFTLLGLMTHLIAFKTHLFIAIKGIMGIIAAEYAIKPLGLIRTFFGKMAKLFAVVALDCRVFLGPVALSFLLL